MSDDEDPVHNTSYDLFDDTQASMADTPTFDQLSSSEARPDNSCKQDQNDQPSQHAGAAWLDSKSPFHPASNRSESLGSDNSIPELPSKRHKVENDRESVSQVHLTKDSVQGEVVKDTGVTGSRPGEHNDRVSHASGPGDFPRNMTSSAAAQSSCADGVSDQNFLLQGPVNTRGDNTDTFDINAWLEENPTKSCFTCPFCCVEEQCLSDLEVHIATTHPDSPEQSVPADAGGSGAWGGTDAALQWVCPFCDLDLESEPGLTAHLASIHGEEADLRNGAGGEVCPLCGLRSTSDQEMREHIRSHESDQTYYGVSTDSVGPSLPLDLVCPVCGLALGDQDLLMSHVESHFSPQHRPSQGSKLKEERSTRVNKENVPVRKKSSTSVDNAGTSASVARGKAGGAGLSAREGSSYKRQYEQSLERAVLRGELSVADYHEQRAGMQGSNLRGVDDGHSRVDGLIEQLSRLYRQQARPGQRVFLCSPTSHFSGSHGDRGWGCGYRNFQMLLSCLITQPEYAAKIFADSRPHIPSIPKLQQMIESTWRDGFDPDGCHQLAGRLVNTQKWIGATEIVATLSWMGVRCRLADFHAPSSPDGTHPRLLEWVTDYFTTRPQEFKPPLYLQHQGHSRTVVGVEIDRDTTRLLLFDPSSKKDHIGGLVQAGLSWKNLRTFRRTQAAFKSRQYQVVAVDGLLTGREREDSKTIKSERIS